MKNATLTITMNLGEASAADPARAAGALEALTDKLLSGRFDGNFDHVVYDAKGQKIGTWRWSESESVPRGRVEKIAARRASGEEVETDD